MESYKPHLDKLISGRDDSDQQKIIKAFEFADKAHGNQKRHSGEPYIIHPLAVSEILAGFSCDTDTIIAALLHDTLEDTQATETEILELFGENVLFLVEAVTKIKDIESRDTKDTSYRTLMRMFFAMADDIRVILIKLADRLHNLKTLEYMPETRRKEIAIKSIQMYGSVAERLNMGEMKGQIEDLAFPFAYPDKYEEFMTVVEPYYEERKKYLSEITPLITTTLKESIENIKIDCRVKHHFSLYQKLKRKNNNINQVHDLVAFRIIVDSIEDCYRALGILHQKYKPLPRLIKDYIAVPKPNGYSSLHTTVFCENGELVEFQIRTHKMHLHAENGIAAHWAYSEQGKTKNARADFADIAIVNKLREWRDYIQNPTEFYNALKLDLFRQRIFVFTPKGDVKDLPEGATPIDFAYSIHSDIGDHCSGAIVNGQMVSLKYKLQNGDVCDIVTSKRQKPTHDWLKIAHSTEAKRRIRNLLKEKPA